MSTLILYASTATLFLVADAIGLRFIVRPVFEKNIGHLLLDDLRYLPAIAFYLFYVAGLLWFVSLPALRDGSLLYVFIGGAFFGAIAYGTYEFTNLATLRDWSWTMVATDLTWGTLLTGSAAAGGVAITRAVT
jgi:uncharacterized membrane protein